MSRRLALAALVGPLLVTVLPARAEPLREPATKTRFDRERTLDGVRFECLGVGLRKVLVFKVYANVFCMEAGVADAFARRYAAEHHPGLTGEALADAFAADRKVLAALMREPGEKLVEMRMVRDVSAEKMREAFRESLAGVLSAESIERLAAAVSREVEDGERVVLRSHEGTLVIEQGTHRSEVADRETAEKLWGVWIGPKSVTPGLRTHLARTLAERAGPRPAP